MRSILLFLCMVACLGNTFSQNRFYLRPTVEIKGYMSHSDAGNIISTPYYEYKIDRIGWLGGLEIGLMAGYKFNKGRTFIETGIKGENSESGFTLGYLDYGVSPYWGAISYPKHPSVAGGSAGRKIPVLFSTQLKHWNVHMYGPTAFSVNCNLLIGINFYHQYIDTSSFGEYNVANTMLNPTIRMDAYENSYTVYSRSILYQAGLSFDLRKRQREWFTLTLYYMHGFRNLSVEMLDITLTDITTNSVEKHHYNSYGRGSAILLEISKKIFWPKTKEQKQMDK